VKINIDIARKVLTTIDAGLVHGVGVQEPGKMCVEAAVCYALGLPHGDDPGCVSEPLRSLKIRLNDSGWSSNAARAKGLRRLGLAQLGSKDALDESEFRRRVVELAIRKCVPAALRAAASVHKDPKHRAALNAAANTCESEANRASALEARQIAAAACAAANAAACAAADAAAYAAAYAYAADAAAYAANAAANAAARAAAAKRDAALAEFAEDVVQILIDMKAPGCQWLTLTEAA
jgi:hypothetical protein